VKAEDFEEQAARTGESNEAVCRAIKYVILPVLELKGFNLFKMITALPTLRRELRRYVERNCG
jgi:hypothetical protein